MQSRLVGDFTLTKKHSTADLTIEHPRMGKAVIPYGEKSVPWHRLNDARKEDHVHSALVQHKNEIKFTGGKSRQEMKESTCNTEGTKNMKKKNAVTEESMEGDNTSAASSIEAKPSDASKSGMMAQAMTSMAAMDKSQLDQVLAMMNSKQFASTIPDDAAAKNAASVAMKGAVKEDVTELFAGEQLSEEFKEKTAVLFEAAVNAKVIAEVVRIEEEYETKLEEEVAQVTDTLTEQIDH